MQPEDSGDAARTRTAMSYLERLLETMGPNANGTGLIEQLAGLNLNG